MFFYCDLQYCADRISHKTLSPFSTTSSTHGTLPSIKGDALFPKAWGSLWAAGGSWQGDHIARWTNCQEATTSLLPHPPSPQTTWTPTPGGIPFPWATEPSLSPSTVSVHSQDTPKSHDSSDPNSWCPSPGPRGPIISAPKFLYARFLPLLK